MEVWGEVERVGGRRGGGSECEDLWMEGDTPWMGNVFFPDTFLPHHTYGCGL